MKKKINSVSSFWLRFFFLVLFLLSKEIYANGPGLFLNLIFDFSSPSFLCTISRKSSIFSTFVQNSSFLFSRCSSSSYFLNYTKSSKYGNHKNFCTIKKLKSGVLRNKNSVKFAFMCNSLSSICSPYTTKKTLLFEKNILHFSLSLSLAPRSIFACDAKSHFFFPAQNFMNKQNSFLENSDLHKAVLNLKGSALFCDNSLSVDNKEILCSNSSKINNGKLQNDSVEVKKDKIEVNEQKNGITVSTALQEAEKLTKEDGKVQCESNSQFSSNNVAESNLIITKNEKTNMTQKLQESKAARPDSSFLDDINLQNEIKNFCFKDMKGEEKKIEKSLETKRKRRKKTRSISLSMENEENSRKDQEDKTRLQRKKRKQVEKVSENIVSVESRKIKDEINAGTYEKLGVAKNDSARKSFLSPIIRVRKNLAKASDLFRYFCCAVSELRVCNVLCTPLLIAFWYYANCLFNIENKKALNLLPLPLTVAFLQSLACVPLMTFSWLLRLRKFSNFIAFFPLSKQFKKEKNDMEKLDETEKKKFKKTIKRLVIQAFWHTLLHVTAMYALSKGEVSFVAIIKAMEPAIAAFLSGIMFDKWVDIKTFSAIILIIFGVLVASLKELTFSYLTFISSMLSNFSSCMRGITAKQTLDERQIIGETLSSQNIFAFTALMSTLMEAPLLLLEIPQWKLKWRQYVQNNNLLLNPSSSAIAANNFVAEGRMEEIRKKITDLLCFLFKYLNISLNNHIFRFFKIHSTLIRHILFSGIFYYVYNDMAISILNDLNPLTHAVANTMKRVLVIIAGVIVFKTKFTPTSIIGSSIALLGVFLYSLCKNFKKCSANISNVDDKKKIEV